MTEPTAREFDMLRSQVSAIQDRVNDIDDHGTRGVTGLTVQLTEVVKDLSELKLDMVQRFNNHDRQHEIDAEQRKNERDAEKAARQREQRDRRNARRWLIGIGIASLAALVTIAAFLVQLIGAIH